MSYPASIQRCHEIIAKLEDKIEELKAQVDYADADNNADQEAFEYGLSPRETDLYRLLKANSILSRMDVLDAFGSESYVGVIITKTRQKLAKHGIKIKNVHSVGYRLEGR
jgi:DNA-binding response OmpR family regulator